MFDSEQRYWIEQVCDTKLTIGEIMRNSLEQREAIWSQPVMPQPPKPLPAGDGKAQSPADRGSPVKQPKEFCLQYNKGHCPRGKRCEHKHRCNRRIDGGAGERRYCNAPHAAVDHDQRSSTGSKGAGKDKNKGACKNKQKWQDKRKTKR